MKNKILICCYILCAIMTSCKKDVLNKTPLDSYTDQSVWNDLSLAEAFTNNLYNILPNAEHNWDNTTNRTWALSSASDEAYNKFDDYNASVMNSGTLTPDNLGNFDIWAPTYGIIQNCNIFLSKIDNVPGDAALRDRLKGEVTYLRAYAYFKLIRDYGGVPLIKQPFDLNSSFEISRSSYDECSNFISDELDKASELLKKQSSTTYGRVTTAAALALKSTVLLYAASPQWNTTNDLAKWKRASDAAKAVIDLPFQLFKGNYADLFTTKNSELIMVRLTNKKYMWSAFQGVEMFLSASGYHGWASFAPSQNLVDAFGTLDGKDITDPSSGYNPQQPYLNRDPRFYHDIVYDGRPYGKPEFFKDRYNVGSTNAAEFYEGGLDSPQGWDKWNNSVTRYTFRKYCDTTYNFNNETQTNKFWVISRLSEIYLNYAEAQFYLGNNGTAIQYLDLIRERAGIKNKLPSTLAGTNLENKIRNERQIELCLEGHRYYDVRRWKIASITENKPLMGVIITKNGNASKNYNYTQVQTRVFKPQHYLLPIPKSEINRTKLNQNPGY
ncbi:RagB/SusD family nutrient uptake outer membrane protein [Pedobacter sp. HDW13]|uniref:RagB/SusD family nutrient uptake outer membrane protein n=1 Tax=Pedobacter sp. HDW13 TaxID=2714940 RepID=UPI0014090A32|nr:RagB/SusD family nutrient uptake outer membrane protein [Pedobacter sp. HDW13]QIL40494.1 RagB/SusD family nutrient uptake outer membrane protein [Pedobacter sp. HDW13]